MIVDMEGPYFSYIKSKWLSFYHVEIVKTAHDSESVIYLFIYFSSVSKWRKKERGQGERYKLSFNFMWTERFIVKNC